MSTITVDNTIRGRPLMIWAGMVDSVAENLVTSSVFGVSFTVTHKIPFPRLWGTDARGGFKNRSVTNYANMGHIYERIWRLQTTDSATLEVDGQPVNVGKNEERKEEEAVWSAISLEMVPIILSGDPAEVHEKKSSVTRDNWVSGLLMGVDLFTLIRALEDLGVISGIIAMVETDPDLSVATN